MLTKEQRPITKEEREILRHYLQTPFYKPLTSGLNVGFLVFCFALVGFSAGTLFALFCFLLSKAVPSLSGLAAPSNVKIFLAGGTLLGIVGIPLWFSMNRQKAENERKQLLHRDLQEGIVEVLHLRVSQVARCKSLEFPGGLPPALFFEIGNSELLFLQGNYFEPDMNAGRFPSSTFDLVRGLHSRRILKLQSLRDPLALTPIKEERLTEEKSYIPQDGDVFPGSLATLDKDLRKLKKGKS